MKQIVTILIYSLVLSCGIKNNLPKKVTTDAPFYNIKLVSNLEAKQSILEVYFYNHSDDLVRYQLMNQTCGSGLLLKDPVDDRRVMNLTRSLDCVRELVGSGFKDTTYIDIYGMIKSFNYGSDSLIPQKKYNIVLEGVCTDTLDFIYEPDKYIEKVVPPLLQTESRSVIDDTLILKYNKSKRISFIDSLDLIIMHIIYKKPLYYNDIRNNSIIKIVESGKELTITVPMDSIRQYYNGIMISEGEEMGIYLVAPQLKEQLSFRISSAELLGKIR